MNIGVPAFNGADALNKSHQSIQNNASKIASKESLEGTLNKEKEIVEMKQSELNFSAVAKVLKTENNMMGFLLDEKV